MNACKGESDCGFFGGGGFIIFDINDGQSEYWIYELLPVLILGTLGGLLGSSFNYVNGKLTQWRIKYLYKNHHSSRRHVKVIEAMLVAFITSTFQFCLPLAFSCRECDPDIATCPRPAGVHYGNFVKFTCPGDNQYNDLATIFFNTQDDAIRNLLSSEMEQEYSPTALVTFFCFFFVLAVITYGISVPSGLFVPSILCGAAYGRLVGMLMTSITGNAEIKEGTYALLGAASFIAGAMRMTVSMCVIILELTNNLSLLPLVMFVLLVSKAVADLTGILPIYDLHIHIKKIPLLEHSSERYFRHLSASDAKSKTCVQFGRVEKVGFILDVLKSHTHNGFPVVEAHPTDRVTNETSTLLGIVLRNHLLVVLKKKISFMKDPSEVVDPVLAFQYDLTEFTKPISSQGVKLDEIRLTDEEQNMYVDLKQFVNTSTYAVQEDMSLAKVYQLFRGLGLRHLCVVPKATGVLGVITRKDIVPEHVEAQYPEVKHLSRTNSYGKLSRSPSFGSFSKTKDLGDSLIGTP
uniref:Chloride channel protein n=3 Tax=Chloropicon primus TaxID=1764295 RepID=A0A7S2SWI3_9CHLO|mmetsp:Transcript_10516/g.29722  ORF Transcript_10516/g.29722 Transcript_10516/m.29722 type:complete len:519 (+) Transcript_10516:491-2047(+)